MKTINHDKCGGKGKFYRDFIYPGFVKKMYCCEKCNKYFTVEVKV